MATSRERIFAAWNGKGADYPPLTTWCFGLAPAPELTWERDGVRRKYWYSLRMEHIHTLPQPWTLEDDFQRVLAWHSLGVDDILDVSVPWSVAPEVAWRDWEAPIGELDERYPVLVREYTTPGGTLRHAVRKTGEDPGEGWVIQPDHVPLIEDYNIPRGIKHAVSRPEDVPILKRLYAPPDKQARSWFSTRMKKVKAFADKESAPVQAWSAFGMDAVIWFTGAESAVLMAMDSPRAFGELMEIIAETDLARTELAAATPGVDMIVERGWYSSTDFWSPSLFDEFVYPHIEALARAAHKHGKKFAYVMTTGVDILGPRLVEAGVDVLYFVDPLQDAVSLEKVKDAMGGQITLVGGTNALSLQAGKSQQLRDEVSRAIEILAGTGRFILHPVDALFPDTPWSGVEELIGLWKELR